MQFVYFYVRAPDKGEELRLSMASVRKNFVGTPSFVVVGEQPPWYDGAMIPMKQFLGIRDSPARMPFRDTQKKIIECSVNPMIEDEFVWIMDDCYMMKPTTIQQMRTPRYDPWYRINVKTVWHQLIRITFACLKKNGKSNLQYGTHLPHVFVKEKLREMIRQYDFPNQLLLFEILYGNMYHNASEAIPYGETWQQVKYDNFLKRILSPMTRNQLEAIDANFINYQSKCWNSVMKLFLKQRFDE